VLLDGKNRHRRQTSTDVTHEPDGPNDGEGTMTGETLPGVEESKPSRIVLHVDMDCFYASCERLREPTHSFAVWRF
jgi:hypothetical protein